MPVLVPMRGRAFPPCRDEAFRAMYIDDSILATVIRLDKDCAPLLPTLGPVSRLESCKLGVPGAWFSLEHRLRDICNNVASIGMKVNQKKTTLMVFNKTRNRQCLPMCALSDGETRLLGLVLDSGLTWWPMVLDILKRARAKYGP